MHALYPTPLFLGGAGIATDRSTHTKPPPSNMHAHDNHNPTSVLWTSMLPSLCTHYTPKSFQVVVQSLLVGLNPGCYWTIIGALAGLMWRTIILSQPGAKRLVVPGVVDLSFYGSMVLVPTILFTSQTIAAQSHFVVG